MGGMVGVGMWFELRWFVLIEFCAVYIMFITAPPLYHTHSSHSLPSPLHQNAKEIQIHMTSIYRS